MTTSSERPEIRTRFDSHDESHRLHLVPPSSADRSPLKSWRNLPSPLGHHHLLESQLEYEEIEEQAKKQGRTKTRTINHITLGFIAYFAVAAGPFGVEDAVRAAGAYPVLLAVVLLPFTWGLPQALMTAELSSMIDENGGYILWVRRGLGQYAGWVNAFNSIASNVCDLPTYPVLFCSYVEAFLASGYGYTLTGTEQWLVKCCALLLVFTSNAVGMRAVALASVLMSLFVLAPFVLEPLSVETFNLATWGSVAPQIDWSLFLSTILWNYQGWDSLGCVAGEVKDGGRTYPIAIVIAMILITINYAFPETIAMTLAPWLGVWVGMAAVVATLGEFNVVMACSSRALWATADYKMLPSCLAIEWKRFGTPIAAVIFQTVTTGVLMNFSFEFLVVLDTFFNNLTLLLEFFAFLRLKYIEKDTERPFVVPFGNVGAWTITLPKIVVLSAVLLAQKRHVWVTCGLFNVAVSSAYLVWRRFQPAPQGTTESSTTSYGTGHLS
ncbi:Amino Acid-Polyamine-Organocation (APC) Family [Phytophthora infestans T30-4]|uniref:Amino Acid-Polyamine-Organocation (APC) Family n=1 Tax=Phytophthora infestans (strain T30-4) TaxID=403677 RepID=D0NNS8_PHYIT|nr:Amino Acid-Polyamine-Organocation (APC) Family [Phytophthora infestans T30-4]EEY62249.1 Amino Acid-Polyamine-Organocation (APC) Family [Phytophthora infestans T30-4]|eukprot:XP_002899280.1 Amino Acid-Polyamine-Organocation (APC) Family [Phytophthora infestans T30-4]